MHLAGYDFVKNVRRHFQINDWKLSCVLVRVNTKSIFDSPPILSELHIRSGWVGGRWSLTSICRGQSHPVSILFGGIYWSSQPRIFRLTSLLFVYTFMSYHEKSLTRLAVVQRDHGLFFPVITCLLNNFGYAPSVHQQFRKWKCIVGIIAAFLHVKADQNL